jgi:hypothetical protein
MLLAGFEQVRAVTVNDEALNEFKLDKDLGVLSGSLEDVFIAQVIPTRIYAHSNLLF